MTKRRRRTQRKRRKYRGGNGKLRARDFFEIIARGSPHAGDIWHVMDITGHYIHAYRVYPSYGAETIFPANLVGRVLRKIEIERQPRRDAAAAAAPGQRRLTWGDRQTKGDDEGHGRRPRDRDKRRPFRPDAALRAAEAGLVRVHEVPAHDDIILRTGYTPAEGQQLSGGEVPLLLRVKIPVGMTAGDVFPVNTGTQTLQLQVPEGMGGGQRLRFAVSGDKAIPLVRRAWKVKKSGEQKAQIRKEIQADRVDSCPDELLACRNEYRGKLLASGTLGEDFVNGWTEKYNAAGKQPHECLQLLSECRRGLRRYQGGGKRRQTRRQCG